MKLCLQLADNQELKSSFTKLILFVIKFLVFLDINPPLLKACEILFKAVVLIRPDDMMLLFLKYKNMIKTEFKLLSLYHHHSRLIDAMEIRNLNLDNYLNLILI